MGAVVAVVGALALAGCSLQDMKGATDAGPPPELEPEWTIEGLHRAPQQTGAHHWLSQEVHQSGVSWGRTTTYGPLRILDARTGDEVVARTGPRETACLGPTRISDDGLVPALSTRRGTLPAPASVPECTRVGVMDASTGKTVTINDDVDLSGLSRQLTMDVDDGVVAVVDHRGRAVCVRLDDGREVDGDDTTCRAIAERVTRADLPRLVDPDGAEVPLTFVSDPYRDADREIGRTDEVLLVRDVSRDGTAVIRAHDLESGETLWQDDDLTEDPHVVDSWSRSETYFVAPSGIARVSYEHPESADEVATTPMVITAVDPRTGENDGTVARIIGGWFAHQFDDMTVALTDQDLRFKATISGYLLPTW